LRPERTDASTLSVHANHEDEPRQALLTRQRCVTAMPLTLRVLPRIPNIADERMSNAAATTELRRTPRRAVLRHYARVASVSRQRCRPAPLTSASVVTYCRTKRACVMALRAHQTIKI